MQADYRVDIVRAAAGRRWGRLSGEHPVDPGTGAADTLLAPTAIEAFLE